MKIDTAQSAHDDVWWEVRLSLVDLLSFLFNSFQFIIFFVPCYNKMIEYYKNKNICKLNGIYKTIYMKKKGKLYRKVMLVMNAIFEKDCI